jgi:hypothetical protein
MIAVLIIVGSGLRCAGKIELRPEDRCMGSLVVGGERAALEPSPIVLHKLLLSSRAYCCPAIAQPPFLSIRSAVAMAAFDDAVVLCRIMWRMTAVTRGLLFELRATSCERLELSSVSSGARDAKVVLASLGRASEDAYRGFLIFALSQRPPIIPNPHVPAPQCYDENEETSATTGSEYSPANPPVVKVVFRRAWTLGCIAIKHGSPAALSDTLGD